MARETFTIEGAGAISLTAEAEGDAYAIPVLLAHGGGQTRRAWRRVVSELAQAGFRAIAFDMRGHGDSDWSPCGAYEMRDFAADLVAAASRLDRGGSSDLVSEEAVLHLRQLVPHAEYTDIADATHMVVGDANDAFSAAIVDFLGRYHSSDTAQPQGTREL